MGAVAAAQASSACSGGFTQNGGSCYGLVDVKETWADTQATCRALGGHLAEVDSLEEDVFIHGTWYWSEGKGLVSAGYSNWEGGSANSKHDENCMKIDATEHGNWHPDEYQVP